MLSKAIGLGCALLGLLLSRVALAEAPSAAAAAAGEDSHATGFMLQGRMQTQQGLLSPGGPGLMLGYQGQRLGLGAQLGLTRLAISATPEGEAESSASLGLFQIVPTLTYDFWQSRDGRTRANVIAGVGFGRASVSVKGSTEDCVFDPVTGAETCSSVSDESEVGASFIPVMLGVGGDYFFGKNFALGVEGGLQGLFVAGIDTESNGSQADIAAGANMQFAYGVLRATLVLGD